MNRINTLIHQIIFLTALLLPLLYILSLMRGFYLSGDTVYFLQFASAAQKFRFWDVFPIHLNPWPPLTAIFYNMLQFLPGGFITEQKAYLIFSFLLALFACYFITKKYSNKISDRIILTSLLLFSSVQVLILRVSLADIQFMAWWILASVFLDNFIPNKKRYLFLQYDFRNWVAQNLYYFCKPITQITMTGDKVTLSKGSVVFSPYELSTGSLKKIKTYHGRKDINL